MMPWKLDIDEGALYFNGNRIAELEYEAGNDAWRQALGLGDRIVKVMNEYDRETAEALEFVGLQIWASIKRHNGDPRWSYGESTEFQT